jgi:hypothetical protein
MPDSYPPPGGFVLVSLLALGDVSRLFTASQTGIAHTAKDTAASLPWTKDVTTGGPVSLHTATGPLASAGCIGDVGLLPAR